MEPDEHLGAKHVGDFSQLLGRETWEGLHPLEFRCRIDQHVDVACGDTRQKGM
eukprot:CAMPEP_0170190990 /NCGR_PEP_ID=MMETSP0040_2-20121228/50608_1 /TAXON_ID=641309 /ORGANISM="Lotharella oceanica, Strain CCMP622" /LENGTH=52 /DNA_ID=CAMNT_0010438965 /DNA_START=270 /DNA_END=428 /DNA_ORIENTATION=-